MRIIATDIVKRDLEDYIDTHYENCYEWNYNSSSGSTTAGPVRNVLVSEQERQAVGWNIPNYHSRVKSGELMPHTPWWKYSLLGTTTGAYDINYYPKYPDTSYYIHNWIVGNAATTERWRLDIEDIVAKVPVAYDMYVTEAAAKVYSNGFDALTALAELVEVKNLFKQTANTLLRLKIPRNWKSLSSEWLSARYGWRPLIHDIINLNEAIKNLNDVRERYSERCGTQYSTSVSTVTTELHSVQGYTHTNVITDKTTIGIRGSVNADIIVPPFQFNPLSTAWEIVPFSFVVDWFVNVGKSISALSFLTTQSKYAASCGYKVSVTRTYDKFISSSTGAFISGSNTQTATSVGEIECRTPCSVPIFPSFILKLNTLKVVDLIALVLQRL